MELTKDKMEQTSTKAHIHCSSYAEAVGEGEQEETNRKERAQALELLVGVIGGLGVQNESHAEELNVLPKNSIDRRPIAQQVVSTSTWLEREATTGWQKLRKNWRKDSKLLFSKERIFEEEKLRLEKLKAQVGGRTGSSKARRQGHGFGDIRNHWQKKSWC